MTRSTILTLALAAGLCAPAFAEDLRTVAEIRKIANGSGGFGGSLLPVEQFGIACAAIGDLDGDGVTEVAVGQPRHEDIGLNGPGSVWILFLEADGTVRDEVEIMAGQAGFTAPVEDGDQFGVGIAALGDLDGDGVEDIAVGARQDGPGFGHGGLYVLLLKTDGTVKSWTHVTNGTAGLSLDSSDGFGTDLDALGDLDGDGVTDLVVGASFDADGAFGAGAVYVLFMNPSGSVKSWQKISNASGGLDVFLPSFERFGQSVANLGDLDGDGVVDLAVGTLFGKSVGGVQTGSFYVVFMNSNGTVKSTRDVAGGLSGFTGALDASDNFGSALASLGDVDGDGTLELAVGAARDDDAGNDAGAIWMLSLAADGTVVDQVKTTSAQNGFTPVLGAGVAFGSSLANLGDLDGDGHVELMVGSSLDNTGAGNAGAAYVCFLGGMRFRPLGFALEGAGGEVTLEATGDVVGGAPLSMSIANAASSAPGFLLISPLAGYTPALGGTVVPDVTALSTLAPITTDPSGALTLGDTWPAGLPDCFSVFVQVWVADATLPAGWAASQGLQITQL